MPIMIITPEKATFAIIDGLNDSKFDIKLLSNLPYIMKFWFVKK